MVCVYFFIKKEYKWYIYIEWIKEYIVIKKYMQIIKKEIRIQNYVEINNKNLNIKS